MLCLEKIKDMLFDSRVHYHIVSYDEPKLSSKTEQAQAYQEVARRIDSYVVDNTSNPDLIVVRCLST